LLFKEQINSIFRFNLEKEKAAQWRRDKNIIDVSFICMNGKNYY